MDEVLAYSTSKANYHTDKIKDLQDGKDISPITLQIDPESWCNDNCRFCAYREELGHNTEMLSLIKAENEPKNVFKPLGVMNDGSGIPRNILLDIPRQMVEAKIPSVEVTGGGEPTMSKNYTDFIQELINYNREIALVTNASNLNQTRIKQITDYDKFIWLRVSMDASNKETHRKVHRTSGFEFEKRLDTLTRIVDNKKTDLEIGVSFIINPDNVDDLIDSAELFASIGVNHLRYSWQYDKSGNAELEPEQIDMAKKQLKMIREKYTTSKFKVYSEIDRIDTYGRPNDDFDNCWMQKFVWAIGANSLVYPCCIQKYKQGWEFGDLRQNTLLELISKANIVTDVTECEPCWLRNRNKSINGAVVKPKHPNFI